MCHLRPYVQLFVCVVAVATVSGAAGENSSCPPGTWEDRAGCVLDADLVISEPIELGSFTTLNCRGRRIRPVSAGTGTTEANYLPSVPEVAIIITGERGVDLKNCVIGEATARFDFGIIAINSKNPGRDGHRIRNNELYVRDSAITFLRVDDARISDNIISWTNGFGVSIRRDSDRNRVNNNVLSSPGSPAMPTRMVPGGFFLLSETARRGPIRDLPSTWSAAHP